MSSSWLPSSTTPLLQHADAVRLPHRGEAVGHQDRGDAAGGGQDALEDLGLPAHVELGGWLVEQHQSGSEADRAQRPGECDALPLAAGQIGAAAVAAGQRRVEVGKTVGAGVREGGQHLLVGGTTAGVDVVTQRELEAHEVLEDGGDAAAPAVDVQLAQVGPVDLHRAGDRFVEPAQQLGQGGLAGAVLPDAGHGRAGRDGQVEAVEHQPVGAGVAEAHRPKPHLGRRKSRCGKRSRTERPGRRHRRLQPLHRGDRRSRPVQGPVHTPERDGAAADGDLSEHHRAVQRQPGVREREEEQRVRAADDDEADQHRALAQPGRGVLQVEQPAAPGQTPVDGPVGEAEQPQLLGRRRVDPPSGRHSRRRGTRCAPRCCCGPARPSSRAAASGWRPTRHRAGAAPITGSRQGRPRPAGRRPARRGCPR